MAEIVADDLEQALRQANQLQAAGRFNECRQLCQAILQKYPGHHAPLHLLGIMAILENRLDDAVRALGLAAAAPGAHPTVLVNYGEALRRRGLTAQSLQVLQEAVRLLPNEPTSHYNHGCALLLNAMKFGLAAEEFRNTLRIKPDYWEAWNNLGNSLRHLGKAAEATACFEKAATLPGSAPTTHSNAIFMAHYLNDRTPEQIFDAHLEWASIYAEPLRQTWRPHANDRSPDRKLRIGYVSPTLVRHALSSFLLPLMQNHDRTQFQIVVYYDGEVEDPITQALYRHTDLWRNVAYLSNEQVVQQIREDQIDILIDLNGHTDKQRLVIFAQKPAPVQATWLGYLATTGMTAMDYRITDAFVDPPGQTEHLHTEKLIRLPGAFYTYSPNEEFAPAEPLPAKKLGFVTFGVFSRPAKAGPWVLDTWAQILQKVPNSRLLYNVNGDSTDSGYQHLLQHFESRGIANGRVGLVSGQPYLKYLDLYQVVDIALDPFPCVGHTTTCDALWMGVPTVTLAGRTFATRLSASVLHHVGLDDWITTSPQQYVERAVRAANSLDELEILRPTLRDRMRNSVILDAVGFARKMEAEYRKMWKAWLGAV